MPQALPEHEVVKLDTGDGIEKDTLFYKTEEHTKFFNDPNAPTGLTLNPDRPYEKLFRPSWEKPDLAVYKGAVNLVNKPNVFMFIHKFTRAGDVGPFKNATHPVKTPTWDKLAKDGISFARAYSQISNMGANLDTIMYGREPDSTGSYNFKDIYKVAPHFLPNLLEAAGYEVLILGLAIWDFPVLRKGVAKEGRGWREEGSTLRSSWGPEDKTDTLVCRGGPGSRIPREGKDEWDGPSNYSSPQFATSDDGKYDCQEERKLEFFMRWLKNRNGRKPLAVFFSIDASRGPYRVPYHFYQNLKTGLPQDQHFKFYDDARTVPRPATLKSLSGGDVSYNYSYFNCREGGSDMPADDALAMRADYYASIQYGDWIMGRALEEVDKRSDLGGLGNTMVLSLANQGSMMGEYGQTCGYGVLESISRIPLVISYPGLPVARRGQICWELVEQIDVFPTIMEMCGVPLVDYARKRPLDVDGRSLLPLFRNVCARVRDVARSQYPRCGEMCPDSGCTESSELFDYTEKLKRNNPCTKSGRGKFASLQLAGYSVRSKDFRMNVWMANPS